MKAASEKFDEGIQCKVEGPVEGRKVGEVKGRRQGFEWDPRKSQIL